VPGRQQVRVILVQAIFEPAERTLALDGPDQAAPGSLVVDAVSKIGHVLVPHVRGQRLDRDQIQLVQVDRRATIDPAVLRPEHDLSGLRVDQPAVLEGDLVLQRGGDLVQVQLAQLEHGRLSDRRHDRPR
jgi:hypothetical protein